MDSVEEGHVTTGWFLVCLGLRPAGQTVTSVQRKHCFLATLSGIRKSPFDILEGQKLYCINVNSPFLLNFLFLHLIDSCYLLFYRKSVILAYHILCQQNIAVIIICCHFP